MRIAVVGPTHPYKGGVAKHTTELAHQLAAAGHDVVLESWSAQYPRFLYPGMLTVERPERPPFEPTRRRLSWRRPDSWIRVGREVAATADRLVLSLVSPAQVPAYLGILFGARRVRRQGPPVRRIALCHNVLPHERRAIDVALARRFFGGVDALLVHSQEQAKLARSLTTKPVTPALLPPALPPLQARGDSADAPRWEPRRRLLFFGLVRPYKGLDVLLHALTLGPPDITLLVAGEFWGGVAETEQLITKLGLAERVELRPGYVAEDDLAELFGGVDALVLPYRRASGTQQHLLARDFRVPVIASRVGALAEDLRDGDGALLCEPDDARDLAATLRRFYEPDGPKRLRAAIDPVDPTARWRAYVDALLDA